MNRKAVISGSISVTLLVLLFALFVPTSASTLSTFANVAILNELNAVESTLHNDPDRKTVCRQGCDFSTLSAAISEVDPLTPSTIAILDGEVLDRFIRIGQGKTVTIVGLGANRTKIGVPPQMNSLSVDQQIFVIEDGADVTLNKLTVWGGNTTRSDGGGIHISGLGTTVKLNYVTVSNNRASSGGGIAVMDGASLAIQDSVIEQNTADNDGGGIYVNGGLVTIERSLINQNSATAGGGISYASGQGISLIANTTLANNSAEIGILTTTFKRGGGAVYVSDQASGNQSSELDLRFSTIAHNQTILGGAGLLVAQGTVSTIASIYAGNYASGISENCKLNHGNIISAGYNLASDAGCQLNAVTDLVSADLVLESLADNGGKSETFATHLDSYAIGIVPTAYCPEVDQRRLLRKDGFPCDIGAYESEKYLSVCEHSSKSQQNIQSDSFIETEGVFKSQCAPVKVKRQSLIVTRPDDPVPDGCMINDCSLREAVIDAGTFPGRDEISFAVVGPILLSQTGNGGNSTGDTPQIGDLDIIDDLILKGNITDVITIDASGLNDRIFDIYVGTEVAMFGLELTGGNVSSGPRGGGAILNRATFVGDHLLIRNNTTVNSFGYGAAIQSTDGGDFTLTNSEIISNSAKLLFSGVYNWNSTMELNGVTIAGNHGAGAVVYNYAFGGDTVLWMRSVTLANNSTGMNYGLGNRYKTTVNPQSVLTYVHNSVIGEHSTASCDAGVTVGNNSAMIVSLGYNLAADSSCNVTLPSDLSATDPLLNPLETGTGGSYNGRLILKPTFFSPLFDRGDSGTCPGIDARGVGRPQYASCDIGAVELTAAEAPMRIYLPFVLR